MVKTKQLITTRNVLLGWLDAVITVIVFVFIPLYLFPFISRYASDVGPNVGWIPVVGIGLAALAFLSRITKGSKYNGVVLIPWGLVIILYELVLFGFGSISFNVRPVPGETIFINLAFPLLFILLLVIPALYIVRGAIKYAGSRKVSAPPKAQDGDQSIPPPPPPEPIDAPVAD